MSCFLPGMVLYQSMQFSQKEIHSGRDTHGETGGKESCGTKPTIQTFHRAIDLEPSLSEASESLRGWHAKRVWSTTENAISVLPRRTELSLRSLRREDETG